MKRFTMLVVMVLFCMHLNSTTNQTRLMGFEENGTPECGPPTGPCYQPPYPN